MIDGEEMPLAEVVKSALKDLAERELKKKTRKRTTPAVLPKVELVPPVPDTKEE